MEFDFITHHIWVRLTFAILVIFCLTFSNAFNLAYIYFERYGQDPLKRSIFNQISVQVSYGMILNNLIVMPSLAWRVYVGALDDGISCFVSFLTNLVTLWWILVLCQYSILKVLQTFK